jgi:hypothetical protein
MMAARRKRSTGKPPEEKKASSQSVTESEEQENQKAEEAKATQGSRDRKSEKTTKSVPEFPFMEKEIPDLVKTQKGTSGFQNKAPLQADERARDLLRSTLQHPISLTAEDLLNVSEPMRNELKKLLTKRRVERKSVTFVEEANKTDGPWRDLSVRKVVSELPEATCEILEEDREGMHKGSIVIGDPVSQFLATLKPSEKSKIALVARESQGLRAIYPLINGVGEVESLLDSGSQIISMARTVAQKLEISWDPDITIDMESANRSIEKTLGLAKNVPIVCGGITVYLQIHILASPAYKVLLGRPFDTITESLVKNERDGNQTLTLTDPNTGERCQMHTYERGKVPEILKRAVKSDFRLASMKQC